MVGCAIGGWLIAVLAAAPVPAPPPEPAPPPPSMELLLHLAEFGDAEDRYVDPAELEAALPEEPEVDKKREAREAEDDGSPDEKP